jgi:hypothetical protein
MAVILLLSETENVAHYAFWCPGCNDVHVINEKWEFDDNYDEPTIFPSILVEYGATGARCHLFVEKGYMRFLADTTHELTEQTVPMGPLPAWLLDLEE